VSLVKAYIVRGSFNFPCIPGAPRGMPGNAIPSIFGFSFTSLVIIWIGT